MQSPALMRPNWAFINRMNPLPVQFASNLSRKQNSPPTKETRVQLTVDLLCKQGNKDLFIAKRESPYCCVLFIFTGFLWDKNNKKLTKFLLNRISL